MSVCKNVSSAHSAWSKMNVRVQDEGGKERGALGCQETPIMPRGERVCWSIFKFYIHVPDLFPLSSVVASSSLLLNFSSPSSFLFLCGLPPLVGGLHFFACWLCLAPFRFHDKGMQSAEPQGAYYDGRCSTARVCRGDAHFPI